MSALEEKNGIWTRFLSLIGARGSASSAAVAEAEERERATREKLAELGRMIDVQVESLGTLENKWQMTCEGVDAFVRERDERDAAVGGMLEQMREDVERLGVAFGPQEAGTRRRNAELLKGIYEESRFYVGMADNLKDMLQTHKECLDGMFAAVREMTATLGEISGVTLSAAMLSARYGEDATEFASICDRIRERVSGVIEELGVMRNRIAAEQVAYEDTFDQLLNLTEQLFKNRDTITAIYEMSKEKGDVSDEEICSCYDGLVERLSGIQGQLSDSKEINRSIDDENGRLYAIRGEETQSRIEIESVVEEIRRMTAGEPEEDGGETNEN